MPTCPHCGAEEQKCIYKVTAGYYLTTKDYFVAAMNESDAERKAIVLARKEVHPKSEVLSGTSIIGVLVE